MKILCIGPNPGNIGGIETFVRNLKYIFREKISFYAITKQEKLYTLDNSYKIYDHYHINLIKKIYFKTFRKLIFLKYIKEYKIFILNSPKMLCYFFRINRNKKILIQHQTAKLYWERSEYFSENLNLLKRVQKEIDVIVTLSPYDKIEFEKKFDLKKVVFIRHKSEMPLLKEIKVKNKNLIMVCRLDNKHKRIDLAINAMKKLPDFNLNICGEGLDKKMLKVLSDGMDNVFFHGSTNKVQEKLDENGIYVMTSDYEGYGISNIEAMRRGLPIILRNTYTAARDIVQGNGVLLEKEWDEDEFVKAVKNIYINYDKYSRKSLELGRRHDFEIIKDEWKKLIKKLN